MALSRRDFLKRGGLLAGAAGAAALGWDLTRPSPFAPPPPARRLGRCVAIGPAGVIEPRSAQDLRVGQRGLFADTRTDWVRLWPDWPTLQPTRSAPPGAGGARGRLLALDAQVRQANLAGLRVILTPYRFPRWANGTAGASARQLAAWEPDRLHRRSGVRKELEQRLPADVSVDSPWGRWIAFLVERYHPRNRMRPGTVEGIELCNEPNFQPWPQQGPSAGRSAFGPGEPTAHETVAAMFATGRAIVAGHGGEPMLLGPATSDVSGDSRLQTGYDAFTDRLLDHLDAAGFWPGRGFAWSHHNYEDVTYDQGPGTTAPDRDDPAKARSVNRAADVRRRLRGRWAGWPLADPLDPGLMLTEGGATLPGLRRAYGLGPRSEAEAKQAELLERSLDRMARDAPEEGHGVALFTNYLFYSDRGYDSGLCDFLDYDAATGAWVGGGKRPAYAAWKRWGEVHG